MGIATGLMGSASTSMLPARFTLGYGQIFHGVAKLKPSALEQTAGFFEQVGLVPGRFWARVAGAAETFGGVAMLLGIATRPAALAIMATQAVAIAKVHAGKGFDNTQGGWEYNALILALAAGMFFSGPGKLSAHELLERRIEPEGLRRLFALPKRRRALRFVKAIK